MFQMAQHIQTLLNKLGEDIRLQALILVIFSLIIFLPGQSTIPPMDRDEPRFAQATKQMIESNDFVDIRFQNEARHKKPVGIYWIQATVVKAADALGVPNALNTIALYRIPSMLGAIGVVLLTFWAGLAFLKSQHAFLAALMMASSILLSVEARLAKTDALLCTSIMLSIAALLHIRKNVLQNEALKFYPLPFLFWFGLGLSVLLKGPVGMMIIAFPLIALGISGEKQVLKSLKPLLGLSLFAAIVAPWFVAITIKSNGQFFAESLGKDFSQKLVSGKESHGAPPGVYFAVLWATFWPACVLLVPFAKKIWQNKSNPTLIFLLAWLVPSWLIMEAVPTKLPHYVLPLYPALCLMVAYGLEKNWQTLNIFTQKIIPLLWPMLSFALLIVTSGALFFFERTYSILGSLLLLWAFLECCFAYILWQKNQHQVAIVNVAFASLIAIGTTLGVMAPKLNTIWISSQLSQTTNIANCDNPQLASAGFSEPSLVFLTQTNILLTNGEGAANMLAQSPCAIAFVEKRQWEMFDKNTKALNLSTKTHSYIRGININGGRKLDIAIVTKSIPN